RSPVSAARFLNDASSHLGRDLGRSIRRIAVNNDDFSDEIGRNIGEYTSNRLRFVMGRDDDGHSHWMLAQKYGAGENTPRARAPAPHGQSPPQRGRPALR